MAHAEPNETGARPIEADVGQAGGAIPNGDGKHQAGSIPVCGVRAESDARLVERARLGDEDAFAELVTRHERKLIRVLVRIVHDQESARDLAQETFWKVYNRLDRFDLTRRFGPWLFRIGLNLAFDWLRKHPTAVMISIDGPSSRRSGSHSPRDSDPDFAQRFEPFDPDPRVREDLVQEVRFILEQIPLSYRTILILRDLEGFSSAEAAAIINRREGTIRWRLSKAREMFRLLWEKRQHWDRRPDEPVDSSYDSSSTSDSTLDRSADSESDADEDSGGNADPGLALDWLDSDAPDESDIPDSSSGRRRQRQKQR